MISLNPQKDLGNSMKAIRFPSRNQEAGLSTLLVLSVMATLAVFVGVSLDYSMSMQKQSQRLSNQMRAVAIGDGALMYSFGVWREICRLNSRQPMPTAYFTYIPVPPASYFPDVQNYTASTGSNTAGTTYTVANFRVKASDPQLGIMSNDNAEPIPSTGADDATNTYNYVASVDVTLPARGGNVTATVRRNFQKQVMSPWNWAIFYVDPLEIHPGPPFVVTGWVHTNSVLYTGHSSLTFGSKVTYANDWMIGFAPGDSSHNGETAQPPNSPSNLPPALDIGRQPFGLDSSRLFSNTNANDNDDSYHELIELPDPNYPDPLDDLRYSDQAGIKILIDSSNGVKYYRKDGTQISSSSSGADYQLWKAFSGAITTNISIQDNREQNSVRLAALDVGKIYTAISTGTVSAVGNGNPAGFNQIVYISDQSASKTGGTPKRGIKLINGQLIPNQGLTIASNNPVYIKGDFNTGGPNPPSNSGDSSSPTVAGYTRQPACVAADAVTLLSNAWVDSNSSAALGSRDATNTTVNTALLAGIVSTSNGAYSGGAENFPRFMEDWSGGKTLTYYGSMVQLYKSQQSTGTWGKSNVYNAPTRNWFFDTNFRKKSPPGSLMIYSYVNSKWSLQ